MGLLLAVIYLAFVGLGLPDSLLGAGWPTMYAEFGVPVSYAGVIAMIITVGTIFTSVQSDRLTKRFGAGKITAFSTGLITVALFGFSMSHSFWMLCLWAIPYGLGAGSVDAALNNYVALHYKSRHMSWLHCMWGVGISVSPYVMGYALSAGHGWNSGYRMVAFMLLALTAVLVASLPLWKERRNGTENKGENGAAAAREQALPIRSVLAIPGAKEIMLAFFGYCALESTAGLWASSYLALHGGVGAEDAARYAAMFFIGITAGRAANGFATVALSDASLVRIGLGVIFLGLCALALPTEYGLAQVGLVVTGLGCAPVYPCIIHSTPERFGAENSQAVIGIQMAFAYTGACLMPPLFGLVADHITISLFPAYLFAILILMTVMHERMLKKTRA